MDLTSLLSLAQAAGLLLVAGAVLAAGAGLGGALISLLVVNGLAAAAMALVIRPYLLTGEQVGQSAARLFLTAFPYGVLAILAILYFRVDIIMLASLSGAEAAGRYNAALRLFEAGLVLPAALSGALFPVMSRQLIDGDLVGLLVSYRQAVRLLLLVAVPAAAAMIFFAGWTMSLFFGQDYAGAGPVLLVLGLSWILFFINAPLGNLLAASKLMPRFLPYAAANTGLNIGLNFWLIPPDGGLGRGPGHPGLRDQRPDHPAIFRRPKSWAGPPHCSRRAGGRFWPPPGRRSSGCCPSATPGRRCGRSSPDWPSTPAWSWPWARSRPRTGNSSAACWAAGGPRPGRRTRNFKEEEDSCLK